MATPGDPADGIGIKPVAATSSIAAPPSSSGASTPPAMAGRVN
ncbi:hypothetical protein [Amycolatopsis keratiniphila]|nr:hypothetical protein [Amycolatopsis keratiniphila]